MTILAIDTSCSVASAALLRDGQVLRELKSGTQLDHSRMILPLCERLLGESGEKLSGVDVFCAVTGPGSYTGIRIGVSSVKGFCFALSKPCFGASSLLSAAYSGDLPEGVIWALVHARQDEFYVASFEKNGEAITRLSEDRAMLAEEIKPLVGENHALCGSGAGLFFETTQKGRLFKDSFGAAGAAKNSCQAALSDQLINCRELMPSYLKPPQAERLRGMSL